MLRVLIFCGLVVAGCVVGAPRNDDIGCKYLGARYVADPLGEGFGYDSDPLIRDDAFDCTTFVETSIADGDIEKLTRIRYRDGRVAFDARNHFIETDWLTNNADIVRNVSHHYAPTAIRRVTINRGAWARAVHGVTIDAAPVTVDLEYIPYSELNEIKNNRAMIVLFVVGPRDAVTQKIATDIAVVHMGFLLPGGRILRHASTGRGVVDDNFSEYVEMRRGMRDNIGIVLVEIK